MRLGLIYTINYKSISMEMMSPKTYLRVVAVLEVQCSHTVQPGLPQLWRVAVGLGQAVVEIHQLLWVILVGLCGDGGRTGGRVMELRGGGVEG